MADQSTRPLQSKVTSSVSNTASSKAPAGATEPVSVRVSAKCSRTGVIYEYDQGRFYCARRIGQSLTLMNDELPVPAWFETASICIDPARPENVWIALGDQGLYRSDSWGSSFERCEEVESGKLKRIERRGSADGKELTYLHLTGEVAGLGLGEFVSDDGGSTWKKFGEVLDRGDIKMGPTDFFRPSVETSRVRRPESL